MSNQTSITSYNMNVYHTDKINNAIPHADYKKQNKTEKLTKQKNYNSYNVNVIKLFSSKYQFSKCTFLFMIPMQKTPGWR